MKKTLKDGAKKAGKRTKKFFEEFKAFANKGNAIDLAVGVVIGTAFTKIVNSLVSGLIMPLISVITGGADVSDWKWVIEEAVYDAEGILLEAEVAFQYGIVIQAIIDFIIIAFVVFLIVKLLNSARKLGEEAKSKAAELIDKIDGEEDLKEEAKEEVEEVVATEPAPEEVAPVEEENKEDVTELLKEIRDLLKKE